MSGTMPLKTPDIEGMDADGFNSMLYWNLLVDFSEIPDI